MIEHKQRVHERGATALFIVIFSVLLMSTITVSFLTLMVREQQRAVNDELSQSAYDSALAGVEDAKRVIVKSKGSGSAAQSAQRALEASQNDDGCQEVGKNANGITDDVSEVPVQSSQSSVGSDLNQAYTCVKVNNLTDTYETTVEDGQMVMVPLRMQSEINRLVVSWQLPTEAESEEGFALSNEVSTSPSLFQKSVWNNSRYPAMMRAQTITPSSSFSLDDFNSAGTNSTAFLYPSEIGATVDNGIRMPERNATVQRPNLVRCNTGDEAILLNIHLCSVSLDLRREVAGQSDFSYLVLQSIYRGASVKVEGYYDDRLVQFDGAQPTVDSTGRANDLFRRVLARLSLGGEGEQGSSVSGPLPYYAVDVSGNICKNFYVTSDASGRYEPQCTP